jgi:hypothetical protein
MEKEHQFKIDVMEYRKFVSQTWEKMAKLAHTSNSFNLPPNHVAVLFAMSDHLA